MSMMLAIAAAAGSVGGASGDVRTADLKCLFALTEAQTTAAAADKAGLEAGYMYFAGKLFGRDPRFDYAAAVNASGIALSDMDYQAEMRRCAEELDALASAMEASATQLQTK